VNLVMPLMCPPCLNEFSRVAVMVDD
jgi:hypothetical protein